MKTGPERIDAAYKSAAAMGLQLRGLYFTMGQYDLIGLIDAPDDETLAKFTLGVISTGNLQSETLRAFNEFEFEQLVAGLPDALP
jgi:uncharacterized protein with GYD domain